MGKKCFNRRADVEQVRKYMQHDSHFVFPLLLGVYFQFVNVSF